MRTSAIMLAALAVAISTSAFGEPVLSTYTLIGTPVNPPSTSVLPVPNPLLQVSLNPDPAPPFPDPNSYLSLTNPTNPIYYYPQAIEIADFSFDIEQTLNIGSASGGAGEGKVTFNPFQITSPSTDMVHGVFQLVDETNQVLETFDIDIAGIDPTTLQMTTPSPLSCLPCAAMTLSFTGVGPDPVVSFSVSSGTTEYAFAVTPIPSTMTLFSSGLAVIGLAIRKRRRALRDGQVSRDCADTHSIHLFL